MLCYGGADDEIKPAGGVGCSEIASNVQQRGKGEEDRGGGSRNGEVNMQAYHGRTRLWESVGSNIGRVVRASGFDAFEMVVWVRAGVSRPGVDAGVVGVGSRDRRRAHSPPSTAHAHAGSHTT